MMEFILWVVFTKIVSQVVIIKKTVIIEKDCDYWWLFVIIDDYLFLLMIICDCLLLLMIICDYWWLFVIIEKDCNKINLVVL